MAQSSPLLPNQIAAALQRALVIDGKIARSQFLADLLRSFKCVVRRAPTSDAALSLAGEWNPQVIFLSHEDGELDGMAFTRALRRSDLACRRAPVILQLAQPTGSLILAGCNAGVDEFLMQPISLGDLTRRLEAVLLRRREWVETADYVGPDRRRTSSSDYRGPERRFMRLRESDAQAEPHLAVR